MQTLRRRIRKGRLATKPQPKVYDIDPVGADIGA